MQEAPIMNSNCVNNRLTTEGMLAEIESCKPLAWSLAKKFRRTNPRIALSELYAVALYGLKLAALAFDPTRGTKFITPAYRYAWLELLNFCRVESAAGFHVPCNHEPYYAVPGCPIEHEWQHPQVLSEVVDHECGSDFWEAATRDLTERERAVVLGVFRDERRQVDVAEDLGISKPRVGQLLAKAVRKLRGRNDLMELAGVAG